MKLDKIRFAQVVAYIGSLVPEHSIDVYQLDSLIDIEVPEPIADNNSVDHKRLEGLMKFMVGGTNKIDAIREYRNLTGMPLKESKEAVERHWVSRNDP